MFTGVFQLFAQIKRVVIGDSPSECSYSQAFSRICRSIIVRNMLYSYIHRYFTLLTIWTSTYIEKFFLKFLNIVYLKIGIFPFCCMIIDGVDHLSVTYFSEEPVLSVAITTKLQVCKQGRFSSNSFLRQFLPCMLDDWRYVSSFVPIYGLPAAKSPELIQSINRNQCVKTVISCNIVKFAKRFLSLQKLATSMTQTLRISNFDSTTPNLTLHLLVSIL